MIARALTDQVTIRKLKEVLAANAVSAAESKPYGCSVKYVKQ